MDAIKQKEVDTALEKDIKYLFSMLDEALADYREGRVLSEEDFWAEYDSEDFLK